MTARSWRALPAFLAVAEHRSFTRAARALGVSTSALSQAVRALEAEVGTALLARTTRSVATTEAGRRLVEAASPALRELDRALEAAVTPDGEPSGSLRLSVPGISIRPVIAPLIAALVARHPRIRVDLDVDDRLVNIVTEGFDAGVRLVESVERDMTAVRLSGAFRFVVVGSPVYLARHGRPSHPRELSEHACIGFRSPTDGTLLPWDLERRGRVWKVPMAGALSTNRDLALLELALNHAGLAYVSEAEARVALDEGRLEVVLDDWAPEVPGFFLYFPSRARTSPALRALLDGVAIQRNAPKQAHTKRRTKREKAR